MAEEEGTFNLDEFKEAAGVEEEEEKRRTLLDVSRATIGKAVQFRLVLIARINDEHQALPGQPASSAVPNFFDNLLSKAQGYSAPFTGLLLLYPVQCIAVIEGSYEGMQAIVKLLSVDGSGCADFISKVRVLVLAANAERQYKAFFKKTMNLVAPRVEGDYSTTEPFEVLVAEVLTQLAMIGRHMAPLSQMAAGKELDTIQEKKPEAMVSQDLLGYLLTLKEIPSPQEYTKFYSKRRHVKLDSDIVWPMRPRLLDQIEQ